MTHISLVNAVDGTDLSLETALGISSSVNGNTPASFSPTGVKGGVAIAPGPLPLNPTPGTLAIDSEDNNKFKWWTGTTWVSAGASA